MVNLNEKIYWYTRTLLSYEAGVTNTTANNGSFNIFTCTRAFFSKVDHMHNEQVSSRCTIMKENNSRRKHALGSVGIIGKLTTGLKSSMTEIRPYIPMSRWGRRPSGVTTWISSLVFLAMIKFRSSAAVKLPTTAALTAVGLCAVTT